MPIDWPDATPVDGFFTLRDGGLSAGRHGNAEGRSGLNVGAACGDDPAAVRANRARVSRAIGRPVVWLRQVHGIQVFDADTLRAQPEPVADAAFTTRSDVALAIQVADCLPVVIAACDGSVVGVAHAGWRGLAAGVIEALVAAMRERRPGVGFSVWLGPRIGPSAFEVGADVRDAFTATDPLARVAFNAGVKDGKWLADLGLLAMQRLHRLGIDRVHDTGACTFDDPLRFWSFRRDRDCGRMAAVVARRPVPRATLAPPGAAV